MLIRYALVLAVLGMFSLPVRDAYAQEVNFKPGTPIADLLNLNGCLNLDAGFSGSVNTSGYRMLIGKDGTPRFLPTAKSMKPQSPESDPSDVYWDDAFETGMDDTVYALAADGTDVYAGGAFSTAGGVSADSIAKWDGTSWSALGTGITGLQNEVHALAVIGTDLYVGGYFTEAGSQSIEYIAKWNGASWTSLGAGTNDWVEALAVSGTDLYVGGWFTMAGGSSANRIAKWDGASWSSLGTGMNFPVFSLAMSGSDLYAGGWFTNADGTEANFIAKWNGSSWSALGTGMDNLVYALAVAGPDLYAGGWFWTADGEASKYIARWNGTSWSALGTGVSSLFSGGVYALAASGTDVYVGGWFETAGGQNANGIAKWDGAAWSTLGTGMFGQVQALAISKDSLFLGGGFGTAGVTPSNYFGHWQPRVNAGSLSFSANPGVQILGNDMNGFYKPALLTTAGTTVSYGGGLPVQVTLQRAPEINVGGKRVNGAFSLSPSGVSFGGSGATLRVEFSQDDIAAYGGIYTYNDFRIVQMTYPGNYPTSMEAATIQILSSDVATPIRVENGRQIYAITIPIVGIASTYGAVPNLLVPSSGVPNATRQYR